MNIDRNFLRNSDLGVLILRLSVGGLLLFHGIGKLIGGVGAIAGMLAGLGLPEFLAYGTLLCEVVAPVLIIIGLWTRAASAAVVFNMIVAILMAHLPVLFSVDANGGWGAELPALYLLGALALCFIGGGRYAVSNKTIFD
jgi:putative oxidoreductase